MAAGKGGVSTGQEGSSHATPANCALVERYLIEVTRDLNEVAHNRNWLGALKGEGFMEKKLVKAVEGLIEESSAPEVVEAIIAVAHRAKAQLEKTMPGEAQGWEIVEATLRKALADMGG